MSKDEQVVKAGDLGVDRSFSLPHGGYFYRSIHYKIWKRAYLGYRDYVEHLTYGV